MDSQSSDSSKLGGTVTPAKANSRTKERARAPAGVASERYELRDPFAEVTYRSQSSQEIERKAEQLGATRFHVIAADGTRVPVQKIEGRWQRAEVPEVGQRDTTPPRNDTAARRADPSRADEPKVLRPEASRAEMERLEAALSERYIIKRASVVLDGVPIGQTEYRYRGDTTRVAFTESTLRLATDNNNPSVARSMVDVAQARAWGSLRVSGHEDFRRMVWLEASLRGIALVGYEPNQADQALLRKQLDDRQVNRIEPTSDPAKAPEPRKERAGTRPTVLAALEAVLVAKRVPAKQREAVLASAAENLAKRQRNGEMHKVKVYDRSAPTRQAPVPALLRQPEHNRADRAR